MNQEKHNWRSTSLARLATVMASIVLVFALLPVQALAEAQDEFSDSVNNEQLGEQPTNETSESSEESSDGQDETNDQGQEGSDESDTADAAGDSAQPEGAPAPAPAPAPTNTPEPQEEGKAEDEQEPEQPAQPDPNRPMSANLADFITDAQVEGADEADGKLVVDEEDSYFVCLTFNESASDKEFADNSELTYALPDGFEADGDQPAAREALIATYEDGGQRYSIELSSDSWWVDGNTIHLAWRVRDAQSRSAEDVSRALAEFHMLTNVEIELDVMGKFAKGTKQVDFGTGAIALKVNSTKSNKKNGGDKKDASDSENDDADSEDEEGDEEEGEDEDEEESDTSQDADGEDEGILGVLPSLKSTLSHKRTTLSDVLYNDAEPLDVSMGEQAVAPTGDLRNLIAGATIDASANKEGKYELTKGDYYGLTLSFFTNEFFTFQSDGTSMTYDLPAGLVVDETDSDVPQTCALTVSKDDSVVTIMDNTYEVVKENGAKKLKVTLNNTAPNFIEFAGAKGAWFSVNLIGCYDGKTTRIDFGNNIVKSIVPNASAALTTADDVVTQAVQGLKISKHVEGINEVPEADKSKIIFTVTGPEGAESKTQTVAFSSFNKIEGEADPSYTFDGLAAGEYTVAETGVTSDAYKVTTTYANDGKVTVSDNKLATMTVTNSYAGVAKLQVSKKVKGDKYNGNEVFIFKVAKADETEGDTLPSNVSASAKAGTTATFDDITYTKAGTYLYTITEVEPSTKVEGMSYDTTAKYAKVVVDDSLKATITYGLTKEAAEESLTVTNEYAKSEPGSLSVRKIVSSTRAADKQKSYSFTVTLSDKSINGKYGDMTFKKGVAKFKLKHNETKRAKKLPLSTKGILVYTVKETNTGGLTARLTENKAKDGKSAIVTCTNSYRAPLSKKTSNVSRRSTSRALSSRATLAKTGDDTNYTIVIVLAVVAVGVIGFALYKRRKQ